MRFRCICLLLVLCTQPFACSAEEAPPPPLASQLIQYAREQVGCGYIWGASGQVCDAEFRFGRAEVHPEAAGLIRRWGAKWDGARVYDCIGLFKGFLLETLGDAQAGVNTTLAWREWVAEWGTLGGAVLTPGMALFRIEGPRMLVKHIGVYEGEGRVIHARGTRWGVVEDRLPGVFTHWARLNWLVYDLPAEDAPAVTGVFLDAGSLAVVETDDGEPAPVSATPYKAGKLRATIGKFADGVLLLVLEAPDEISRLVRGVDTRGREITGYVRLTALGDAAVVRGD